MKSFYKKQCLKKSTQKIKSRKNVFCLLALNKQLFLLRYFKNFLPDDFSKYFRESIMKLSETSKSTYLKIPKQRFWKKCKRKRCLISVCNKEVFWYFYFFGKFQILKSL